MKSIYSCCAALVLALAIVAPGARAQETADDTQPPRCTDLSGKVPLPCPSPGEQGPDAFEDIGEPAAAPARTAGEVRPRDRQQADTQRSANTAAAVKATPATEQPHTAAVRPTVMSQPSTAAADHRASIGLHPRTPPDPEPAPEPSPVTASSPASRLSRSPETSLVRNLVMDQKAIWTSPLRIRLDSAQWLVPLLGGTAIVVGSDTAIQNHIPTDPAFRKNSNTFSNYGIAAFGGVTSATWLWGVASHNEKMRETGVLSGEAALDSFALTYAIKYITHRDRPNEGNGNGNFWSNGDSFPSEHAAAAWSVATVFAHEYPGFLTQLFAYGGAAAISAARVTANKHFAADALVGSGLGYFIGRQVYRAHHDREDLSRYGTFERSPAAETRRSPDNMGSAYVPLDSWVYGAFDRLAALGYIHTALAGLRPWTRIECLRLLDEAEPAIQASTGDNNGALAHYRSLRVEFALDAENVAGGRNLGAELESFYARVTGISGKPITDGYHFGQTIVNDYGRPYQQGFNMATGFSTRAEAGPLAFYARGEYQHAPSGPALSDGGRQTIAAVDFLPTAPPALAAPTTNRFRLLDAYVALSLNNWQVSAGKQSLSWGPGVGGAMMFSDNAEPINMIRFQRVTPIELPSIFRLLGPIRTEFFLGQLSGYQFVQNASGLTGQFGRPLDSQPFIHGQKISFKPTANLELGFSRTTIYGGPGYPLTERTFVRSLFATGNEGAGNSKKPGDRRSGMDLTYRIPKLRDWLTFYADGFTDDEFSPVAYPDRSAWRAGLYMPRLPYVHKLDLRAEGVYTDNPLGGALGHGFYYFNFTWRSGYTNNGNLIGSWVGRQGQGAQAWATYHFTPKNLFQVNYRHGKVSQEFIPGGGSLTDVGVRADFWTRSSLSISTVLQYEKWTIPVLAPGPQSNVTTSVQLTFWPHGWGKP